MQSSVQKAAITPEVVSSHGLTPEEYQRILRILGREPNMVELGIFSVMWSEHCSYKTTRKWLKTLPTQAEWVICGPGENAGVIDIGDGQAAIFKMESHNHPSYIEPFQGAATGVGGILRDVFTMGARPVANLNCLRFGSPDHPKTRHLVAGVVSGIGSYGNCVGVPTVGGECTFDPSYNGNILVNAMTVGVASADKIFYSAAGGIGNKVMYVGSKTGRDGIHGATMASAGFSEGSEEKRPTVQVGDPFTEKLLIEACLELMATDAIVAIQDMGAAGLTSSSLEMAGKGDCGIELHLDRVPMREEGMTPYEIMLSESQERMLMVIKPEKEHLAREIFEKWELAVATIGEVTDTGRLVLKMHGQLAANLPVGPISVDAPMYDRPWVATQKRPSYKAEIDSLRTRALAPDLMKLLSCPDLSSKRWVYEQYDHMVGNDTVARPGGDAAVVRVRDENGNPTQKALAITTDCTPRYCYADPTLGGMQAVVETWRNLVAVGASPLAITNCLNFGNPEHPEVMGQIVGALAGMREACLALNYPVVSGNVSLYNETDGKSIHPTPAIGGVGILWDVNHRTSMAFTHEGDELFMIGETRGHLGCSLFLRECLGKDEGTPPPVNLGLERKHGDFVRGLIERGIITACHDVSDGGMLIALAEMCMAGSVGAMAMFPHKPLPHQFAFGEDQGRYIIAVAPDYAAQVAEAAMSQGISILPFGRTQGTKLEVMGHCSISIDELKRANEAWMPGYMAG